MSKREELYRIIRFLIVGVANTLVGLGTIYLCKFFGGISDVPANAIGYSVGLVNSFIWNRNWTFKHSGAVLPSAIRFLCVFASAYAANLVTVLVAIEWMNLNSYIAQAMGILPYTATFYIGGRLFVFTDPKQDANTS